MITRVRSIGRKIPVLVAAMLVVLAFGAVGAGAAQAFEWEIGGKTLAQRGLSSETLAGSGEAFELSGEVAGEQVKVSCSSESGSGKIVAGGTGQETLSLSGCTAVKPAGCTTKSLSLTANTQLIEVGGVIYEKFSPVSTNFGTLTLEGCAAEGKYPVRGSFAGLAEQNKWPLVDQPLSISAAISSAAGTSPTLGPNPATIAGSTKRHLSGVNVGKWWKRQAINNWLVHESLLPAGETKVVKFSGGPLTVESPNIGFKCNTVGDSGTTITGGGTADAKLSLSGCAITYPAGCSMPAILGTNALRGTLKGLGYMYETFTPKSGTVLTSLKVEGCAMEGSYALQGSFSGKGGESGTESYVQPLAFSPAIDAEAGSSLTLGYSGASITGGWNQELTAGGKWGAIER